MKKQKLFTLVSLILCGVILVAGKINGKDKPVQTGRPGGHYIVKLKGNVLYAAGHPMKKASQKKTEAPLPKISEKAGTTEVAVKKTKKIKESAKQEYKGTDNITANNQEPLPKDESVQVSRSAEQSDNTIAGANTFNYENRQVNIHSSIFQLFSGTYIDSMMIVNQLLSDSIRGELSKTKSTDSIQYLKLCLVNSLKDSITLAKLNTLSSPDQQASYVPTGVVTAHCKDASSSVFMDSVVMDVFLGSNLVASGMSDKSGTIQAKDIPEGDYYVVFSRRAYEPFSLIRLKVSSTGQSYIDIPLTRQNSYLSQLYSNNKWLFITTGSVLLLFLMVVLAYNLAKFTEKRSAAKLQGHKGISVA
jgi:hypothetical protein